MHIHHPHIPLHAQLYALCPAHSGRPSACCRVNYKAVLIEAPEHFSHICLSYISYFTCPVVKTLTMFVGVRQGLTSENWFTERDLWIARGGEKGLDLAGVESREKAETVEHVERREVGRDTQL